MRGSGHTKGLSDSIITNCYYRAGSSVNMSFVDDHDCDNCNEIAGVGQRPEWHTDLSSTNIAVRHTSSKFDYVELEYGTWTSVRHIQKFNRVISIELHLSN